MLLGCWGGVGWGVVGCGVMKQGDGLVGDVTTCVVRGVMVCVRVCTCARGGVACGVWRGVWRVSGP